MSSQYLNQSIIQENINIRVFDIVAQTASFSNISVGSFIVQDLSVSNITTDTLYATDISSTNIQATSSVFTTIDAAIGNIIDFSCADLSSSNISTDYLTVNTEIVLPLNVSWTPTLTLGGGSTGITYGRQAGTYQRIGNLVYFSVDILLTSKGTDVGSVGITGFPFTTTNTNAFSIFFTNILLPIGALECLFAYQLTTGVFEIQAATQTSPLVSIKDSDIGNGTYIQFNGVVTVN